MFLQTDYFFIVTKKSLGKAWRFLSSVRMLVSRERCNKAATQFVWVESSSGVNLRQPQARLLGTHTHENANRQEHR